MYKTPLNLKNREGVLFVSIFTHCVTMWRETNDKINNQDKIMNLSFRNHNGTNNQDKYNLARVFTITVAATHEQDLRIFSKRRD